MAESIPLAEFAAAIPAGQALSAPVGLGAKTLVGISMPAGWDAAGLSFQVSTDGSTWQDLHTASAELTVTAAASIYIALDPTIWRGINYVVVRSGTSAAPVNQTAARTVTLVGRIVL